MTRPTLKKHPAKNPRPPAPSPAPRRSLRLLPTKVQAQRWISSEALREERERPDKYLRQAKTPLIRLLSTWTVDDILAAQDAHERGEFATSGLLWLWMQRTSRLKAVLRKRCGALPALPFHMEPASKSEQASPEERAAAQLLERDWFELMPESLLRGILKNALGMGAALCRVSWHDEGDHWQPRLTLWPADAYYFRDTEQRWYARTREGGDVKVCPGRGWFLWLPDGSRSFQSGAVTSLAIPCLLSTMSDADWANYNAANSVVIRLANVPRGASTTSKNLYLDNVEGLGRTTSTLLCEKNLDGSGFGMEQLDTPTGNLTTFERAIEMADKRITIEILGQEKTTDLGGQGARSAVEALQGETGALVSADAEGFSTTFREQVLKPLCLYNWGSADLAPWPSWETTAPEDLTKTASGHKALAEAVVAIDAALQGSGKQLNRVAYLEAAGLSVVAAPTISPEPSET